MPKYKYQPTRQEIEGLRIEVHKTKKGEIKGVTIWADRYWVLDASIMKDKDEKACRIYVGNRNQPLQFEFCETNSNSYSHDKFLELRSVKNKT